MKLFLMHQVKCGGVTLKSIIENQFNESNIFRIKKGKKKNQSFEDFLNLDKRKRSKIALISGHMYFGVHKSISSEFKYLTMLRDPLSRVVSMYYYQRRPEHKYHISKDISLIDYIKNEYTVDVNNGMTRFITGKNRKRVAFGECYAEMFEEAIENIKTHFYPVGILERFDESILFYKSLLNWKFPILYNKKNVNINKPFNVNLSSNEIEIIRKYNEIDIKLYNWVYKNFDLLIKNQKDYFQAELLKFKSDLKEYQKKNF